MTDIDQETPQYVRTKAGQVGRVLGEPDARNFMDIEIAQVQVVRTKTSWRRDLVTDVSPEALPLTSIPRIEAAIEEARRLENDYGDSYEVAVHMSELADILLDLKNGVALA